MPEADHAQADAAPSTLIDVTARRVPLAAQIRAVPGPGGGQPAAVRGDRHAEDQALLAGQHGAGAPSAAHVRAAALRHDLGLSCAVIVRAGAELSAVVAANPLGRVPGNPARFFVSVPADTPAPRAAADLAGLDVEPERAWVIGREAYFWLPDGFRQSKLNAAFIESGSASPGPRGTGTPSPGSPS